jgi:hypothetical protein
MDIIYSTRSVAEFDYTSLSTFDHLLDYLLKSDINIEKSVNGLNELIR